MDKLNLRQKIVATIIGLEIILYGIWVIYELSGPISAMMWAYIMGGSMFFLLPSIILGIWATIESKKSTDLKVKRIFKLLSVLAFIPAFIAITGFIISLGIIRSHPPGVN